MITHIYIYTIFISRFDLSKMFTSIVNEEGVLPGMGWTAKSDHSKASWNL